MSDKDLPAFPSKKRIYRAGYATQEFEPVDGMTLRDAFALTAITGFSKIVQDYGWDEEVLNGHARTAYKLADAMLRVR